MKAAGVAVWWGSGPPARQEPGLGAACVGVGGGVGAGISSFLRPGAFSGEKSWWGETPARGVSTTGENVGLAHTRCVTWNKLLPSLSLRFFCLLTGGRNLTSWDCCKDQ